MEVTLIFPHQLFQHHPALEKDRKIYIIEEWLFFNQYRFHKQKLVLHRSAMKWYLHWLLQQDYKVVYIEATQSQCDIRKLVRLLADHKVKQLHYTEVADDWLRRRLHKTAKAHGMHCKEYPSPGFLNTMQDVKQYFDERKTYFQTDFYIHQRKQRHILLTAAGQPEGGKWTYDTDNREKFTKQAPLPTYYHPRVNEYVQEARDYVEQNFQKNYGQSTSPFPRGNGGYPCNFDQAEQWLEDFLEHRLYHFGKYEDAMSSRHPVLYHSLLSPLLNTGLLTPRAVIDKTLKAAVRHKVPLNSLEGFIRQLMGWREFIHIVYEREGRKQRTTNYWGFTRKIPSSFYTAETGITPVDTVISKVLESGWSHHIERLMIMGNFMILCEFHPDEVYQWFMEMYIDAYDWVMVPNVYGMTQFADGGLMMTKPYISSSNYILKMSDFKKGDWCEVWDALFWRFMSVHRDFFESNPRLGMLLKTWDKMPATKKEIYLETAENYLSSL